MLWGVSTTHLCALFALEELSQTEDEIFSEGMREH